MLNSWYVVALPCADRRTIRQDSLKAGGGMMELEEWCLWHLLSYRCKASQSGTSDRPNPLSGSEKQKLMYVYCARFSLLRSLILAVLTFAGRHVDTFAITAEWMRPPKGPGHIIEYRVVWPAETAIIFVGVKPQPPVVTLHFRHLKVRHKLWKGMSRSQRLLNMQGLPVEKVAMQNIDTIITQICTEWYFLIKCAVPFLKCWPGKLLPQLSGRRPVMNQTRSKSSGLGPKWCGGQKIYTQPPGSQSTQVNWCLPDEGWGKKEKQSWDITVGFWNKPLGDQCAERSSKLRKWDWPSETSGSFSTLPKNTHTREKCIHGTQNVRGNE